MVPPMIGPKMEAMATTDWFTPKIEPCMCCLPLSEMVARPFVHESAAHRVAMKKWKRKR